MAQKKLGLKWSVVAAVVVAIVGTTLGGPAFAAAGDGVITGTVTGDSSAGWDSLATVTATAADNVSVTTPVDNSGQYILSVPPGSYRLTFRYTGEWNFVGNFYGGPTRPSVEVIGDTTITIDSTLEVGSSISGQLTGLTGTLPQPSLSAQATGTNSTFLPRKTIDAETGNYTIDRLPAGTVRVLFSSLAPGWLRQNNRFTVGPQEMLTGIDVVLIPSTDLRASAVVAFEGGYFSASDAAVYLYKDGALVATKYFDSGGDRTFEFLSPGIYTLCFGDQLGDFVEGAVEVAEDQWQPECWDDISAGGVATPIELALGDHAYVRAILTRNVIIKGTINGSFGAGQFAFPGAHVELLREDPLHPGTYVHAATAESGTYQFSNVPPGRYLIRASDGDRGWFDPMYFPGFANVEDATPIVVDSHRDVILHSFPIPGNEIKTTRLSGASRFETAVAISRAQFPGAPSSTDHPEAPVPVVYIANGLDFPDALAAGPAAVVQGGGLLLVRPDEIPASVVAELQRLEPQRIVVVGSDASVSDGVLSQLHDFAANVERIGGSDRYETSAAIIRDAFPAGTSSRVLIATARNFPDALAAGPAAGSIGAPVVLVDGSAGEVDPATLQLLQDLGANTAWIVGGPGSVSESLVSGLRSDGVYTQRLDGVDRYQTAAAINFEFFWKGTAPEDASIIATGTAFADALAGGALAGSIGAPIYLSSPTCVPPSVSDLLIRTGTKKVFVLGGIPSLNADVAKLMPCR